ncbi:hypothetical protein [Spiroplasma endosymbiont of Panzeria rudis]|uniref:hypothetical protein n=1 Tax=Spiroplasma endosymbiont of Panzeria rudis TaxID=3066301 RepID=UPI0030D01B0D
MLVKAKIDNEDASLIIKLGTVNRKSQLIIIGGNKQYGNIFSLEELQDTIKIDITPKLKINSRSLETNEIEENIWDIELKDIPPTPSPSGSNWKEVGTKKDNKTIQFNFIKNKIYRIYYNYCVTNDKTEYSWIYKEFIYSGNNNTEYLDSFIYTDGSYTWLQVNKNSIFMTTVPYPFTFGQLLKLQELQE